MVTDELKNYVRDSLRTGRTKEEIARSLIAAGWSLSDIEEALQNILQAQSASYEAEQQTIDQTSKRPKKINRGLLLSYVVLAGIIVVLGGTILALWQDRLDLSNTNASKVREFYSRLAESQIAFTDAGEMVFPDEQKFLTQKQEYTLAKESFVEVNLRTMRLTLYENGDR